MVQFMAYLHSFINYSYIGSAIILVCFYVIFKIRRDIAPHLKALAYFSALAVPPLTYIVKHVILQQPCTIGFLPWGVQGSVANAYNAICRIGLHVTDFLVPFFGITIVIGLAKSLITLLACKRLAYRYGYVNEEVAPELIASLKEIAVLTGIKLPQIILTSNSNAQAFTFGVFKPVIVISDGVLSNLSTQELADVLKHECAHIKRYDVPTNWLAVMLRDVSFFNPFTHIAFSFYMTAKEEASDDVALQSGANPFQYGATLIKMWRISKENVLMSLIFDSVSPDPGFLKSVSSFEERVARMLDWPNNNTKPRYFSLLLTLVLLFSIIILNLVC